MKVLRGFATVIALVVASPALANAPAASGSCPALFGTPRTQAFNAALRAYELDEVRQTPQGTSVIHHVGKWRNAQVVSLPRFRVLSVDVKARRARVELAEDHPVCAPGVYELSVDDSLGQSAHVLGIVEGGVLVGTDDALWVLPAAGQKPEVEVVWRSHYAVLGTVPPAATSKTAPRRPATATPGAAATAASKIKKAPKRPKAPRPGKVTR